MITSVKSLKCSDRLDLIAERIYKHSFPSQSDSIRRRKLRIMDYFHASESDWNSFYWQVENRISNPQQLCDIFDITDNRFDEINKVIERYCMKISPHYLSLINMDDALDPVGLMAIPSILELNEQGEVDPMCEGLTSPTPLITRRYPDRLILNITNACGTYCRFCQRKRNISENEIKLGGSVLEEAIEYINGNIHIRDVLVTGGDPLMLSTNELELILKALRSVKHVEIIRIGSRMPIFIPQRIDNSLVNMLRKYHPLYINIHSNHPREISDDTKEACKKLADAGIPLGNQMVLLNSVNDDSHTVINLNKELLKCRVKPYYIFFAKNVQGTTHFNCNLEKGLEIMSFLTGCFSGFGIPRFIVNAPKGHGKVPIANINYEFKGEDVELTTWTGDKVSFVNPDNESIATQLGAAKDCNQEW